jgi:hypothetical protein
MPDRETIGDLVARAQQDAPFTSSYADLDPRSRRTVDEHAVAAGCTPEDALAAILAKQTADSADWAEASSIAQAVRR